MTTQTLTPTPGAFAPDSPSPEAPPRRPALTIDSETFRTHFNRKPYLLPHHLGDHPLFALPRLIELARSLPAEFVEYNAGNIPVSIDSRLTPRNGLSVEETIRRIEEQCSWMVMKRVERDPEYNALLNRILDEVQAHAEPIDPGMFDRAGAIFISSPGSVTPYHLDAEYNFLFQLRGAKAISVFDANDRSILSEEELEERATLSQMHRNMVFKDDYQKKAMVFELTTGFALHVPATAPHWVKNGPAVSISFSAGFTTPSNERLERIRRFNRGLRRLGIRPAPVGRCGFCDGVKHQANRAWGRVHRLFGAKDA